MGPSPWWVTRLQGRTRRTPWPTDSAGIPALGRALGSLLPDRLHGDAGQWLHVRRLHVRARRYLAAAAEEGGGGRARAPSIGILAGERGAQESADRLLAAPPIPVLGTAATHCSPGMIGFEAQPEVDSRWRLQVPTSLVMLDAPLQVEQGVVVEGTIERTAQQPPVVAPGDRILSGGDRDGGHRHPVGRLRADPDRRGAAVHDRRDLHVGRCHRSRLRRPAGIVPGPDPPSTAAAARDHVRDLPGRSAGTDVQHRPLPG